MWQRPCRLSKEVEVITLRIEIYRSIIVPIHSVIDIAPASMPLSMVATDKHRVLVELHSQGVAMHCHDMGEVGHALLHKVLAMQYVYALRNLFGNRHALSVMYDIGEAAFRTRCRQQCHTMPHLM